MRFCTVLGSGASVPAEPPEPADDGAAKHLLGSSIPRLALPSTKGRQVSIRDESIRRIVVVYAYPRMSAPGSPVSPEWDALPGARGCTSQTCTFRDLTAEYEKLGARIFGLSVQSSDQQREMAQRLDVPFEILSDDGLRFQKALRLPTFRFGHETFLRRVTFVARAGRLVRLFYPVFQPDRNASDVLDWLRTTRANA